MHIGNRFAAKILWMDNEDLYQGNRYRMKIGSNYVMATVKKILHMININDGKQINTNIIHKNELFL